jgi:hypothetical protein
MSFITELQELRGVWTALFPAVPVEDSRLALWLLKHGTTIARCGILELAVKHQKLGTMSDDHMGRFASAVMSRMTLQEKASTTPATAKEATC